MSDVEVQPEEEKTFVPLKDSIVWEDFAKVDLRVATIVSASDLEGSKKLLRLELDLGFKKIQVFAGIKKHIEPSDLLGKQVVACVNLEPREMKFGLSEGMVLAATDDQGLSLLSPTHERVAGALIS